MMRAGTVLLCLSAALPAPFASGSGVNHGPDVSGPWGLTVDYLKDPVGIDGDAPRFSWKLPAGMKSQSAFQIDAGIWKTDSIVGTRPLFQLGTRPS